MRSSLPFPEHSIIAVKGMIRKKTAPDLIRGGNRFPKQVFDNA